jgi:hypothetical protein
VTTVNGEEVFFDAETGQWVSRSGRVLSAEEAAEAEKKSAREGKLAKGDQRVSRETRDLASTDWDWLMALKMAILVLLLVFIFYLAIGSVRRRRDNP